MEWYEWIIAGIIVWVAVTPIALAFVRGAAMLNKRIERQHDEHEEGLPL